MAETASLSILLVDDHHDGADSLSELLRICGFEAKVFYSSEDAFTSAKEHMPDVLISDIGMPRPDGCDLAIRIRALDGVMPLMIAVTGFANLRDRCLHSGFDYFFAKPADPNDILALLQQHAEKLQQSNS